MNKQPSPKNHHSSTELCPRHRAKVRARREGIAPLATSVVALFAGALLMPRGAQAASSTWLNTGATNANWSTTNNWVSGVLPGSTSGTTADTVTFSSAVGTYGTSGSPILIDNANQNIGSITFATGAGSFFIGGTTGVTSTNALYLSGGGAISVASGTQTINAPLVFMGSAYTMSSNANTNSLILGGQWSSGMASGTSVVTVNATTSTVTLSGLLTDGTAGGKLALNLTGNSSNYCYQVISNGANTFTGGVTVNSGANLEIQGDGSPLGTGIVTIASGANLENTSLSAHTITANNPFVFAPGGGTINYVGWTGATGKALNIGNGTVTLGGNVAFAYGAKAYASGALTIGGAVVDSGSNYSLSFGALGGNAGSMTFQGNSTYGGATTISSGTVAVNGTGGRLASTPSIVVLGGATLQLGDASNGLANRLNQSAPLTLGGSNGGILTVFRGPATANSQALASLTIGVGNNQIANNGTTGGVPTLTFTNAVPYTRTAGAFVTLPSPSNALIAFTNAPSGAANVQGGILTGAVLSGSDFAVAQSGNGTAVTYTANAWAGSNNTNVTASNDWSSTPNQSTNSLRFNTSAYTVTLGGTNGVNSGIIVGSGATSATIAGGAIESGVSGGDLWLWTGGKPLTINSNIVDNGGSSLSVGGTGAGIVTINGTTSYTGSTIVSGSLTVGSGGLLGAASSISVPVAGSLMVNSGGMIGGNTTTGFGGTVTVNAGGTVSGNVTSNVVATNGTANFTNNGTVSGTIIIAPGSIAAGPDTNAGGLPATGHVVLTPGSTTGAIANNGQVDLTGATAISAIGTISGTGGFGGINDFNTYSGGKNLTFADGASLAYYKPYAAAGSVVASMLSIANSGTASFTYFGYNSAKASANVTLNGGTWNIGKIGQNSSNCQTTGTYTITNGATVNFQTPGYDHGTWKVTNGSLNFANDEGADNGNAIGYVLSVDNSGGGPGSITGTGKLTLCTGGASGTNSLTVGVGGSATFGNAITLGDNTAQASGTPETNIVTVNGGTLAVNSNYVQIGYAGSAAAYQTNTFTVSSGTATVTGNVTLATTTTAASNTIVNNLNLSGGKLSVSGALSSGTGNNQTNTFRWSGGQLTIATVTTGSGFNGASGTNGGIFGNTLYNSAGTLAPGDLGFSGRTSVTGNLTLTGGSLVLDLGGASTSSSFKDAANAGKFDYIAVTGTATLGGALSVSLINGAGGTLFVPNASSSLTILTGGTVTGAFSNSTVTLPNDPFSGTMNVGVVGGTSVVLNGYVPSQLQSGATQWSGTANWTSHVEPNGAGAGAKFGLIGGGGTVALGADHTAAMMIFETGSNGSGYTLTGANTLTLSSTIASAVSVTVNSGTHAITTPVTLSNDLSITGSTGSQLTLSGNLSGGSNNLTLAGGKLILAGADTYGNTTISSGTLQIGEGGSTGNLGSGAVTNNGAIFFNRSDALTVSNAIGGTGGIVQNGIGAVNLTASNSYTGTSVINSGTLQIGDGTTNGQIASSSAISGSGMLVFNRSDAVTYGNAISGNLSFIHLGSGTTTLNGSLTSGSNNTGLVANGRLAIVNTGFMPQSMVINSGATLEVSSNGGSIGAKPTTISGSGTLMKTGTTNYAFGTSAGLVNVAMSPGGMIDVVSGTLQSSSNYNGSWTNNQGSLNIRAGATVNAAEATIYVDALTGDGLFVNSSSGRVHTIGVAGGSGTFSGSIQGIVTIAKAGAGTEIFSGSNSYSAGTIVNGGTLRAANPSALGAGPSSLAVNGGTLDVYGNSLSVTTLSGSTGAMITSGAAGAVLLTASSSTSTAYAGDIQDGSGTVSLAKLGTGTLTLGGNLTYSGSTTVAGGSLTIGSGGNMTTSPLTVGVSGVGTVTNNGTIGSNVTVGVSAAYTTINFANSGTVNGALNILSGTNYASPDASATSLVATGHAQLNGGSTTSAITNNGQLDLAGSTAIISIGTIDGSGGYGGINDANTYSGGKTLTFADGSAFSFYKPAAVSGTTVSATLQVTGNGAASFQWFGYNSSKAAANLTFNGGTWSIGKIGQNNSNCQSSGTFTLSNGAAVSIANTGYEHGTWNVTNGSLSFGGSVAAGNGTTVPLNLSVDNSGGGSGSTITSPGALTLCTSGASGTNSLTVGSGGVANFAGTTTLGDSTAQAVGSPETNSVTVNGGLFIALVAQIGNSGAAGTAAYQTNNFTVSSGTALVVNAAVGTAYNAISNVTDTLSLSGGKIVISGALFSGTGGNQTNGFNWTGGQLTASSIITGVGFNNLSGIGGGIFNDTLTNVAGTLAPGDFGASGKTIVSGNLVLLGGLIPLDLGGATASTAWKDGSNSGKFDNIAVTGAVTLGGTLSATLITGSNGGVYVPGTASSLTVLTGSAITGSFSNSTVALANDPFLGTMNIVVGGTSVVLNGYTSNELQAGATQWSGTSNWTTGIEPNGAGAGAKFGPIGGGGTVTLDTDRTIAMMVFDNASGYTLQGAHTLTLSSNIGPATSITLNNGAHTIATPVTLGNDLSVTGGTGVQLTFSGAIAGTGKSLTLNGGMLVLAGSTAYANTTVSSGTLQIGAGGTVGNLGVGAIVDNGTLVLDRSDAVTLATVISGSGGLVQAGPGLLTLTASNSYSGGTTVNSGTLQIGDGSTNGRIASGAISGSGTLVFNRSDAITYANAISGNLSFVHLGSGTTTLNGTLTGGSNNTGLVANGRLVIVNSAFMPQSMAINSGATLELSATGGFLSSKPTTITGAGTLVKSGTGTYRFGGGGGNVNISLGAGALIDVQGGVLNASSGHNGFWTNNLASLNIASGATVGTAEAQMFVDALTGGGILQKRLAEHSNPNPRRGERLWNL